MEFRTEVCQGQEDAAAKALQRVRHDKPYSFKCKGNEEQATLNSKADKTLAEAQAKLTRAAEATPALDRAGAALTKGRKLLAERQKLIKISSEFGWGVVPSTLPTSSPQTATTRSTLRRLRRQPSAKPESARESVLSPMHNGPRGPRRRRRWGRVCLCWGHRQCYRARTTLGGQRGSFRSNG